MCVTKIDSWLCQGNKKPPSLRPVRTRSCCHFPTPKRDVEQVARSNWMACGYTSSSYEWQLVPPSHVIEKGPSVAVLDSLSQHWSDSLGYLSVHVGACWWQQQMQNPQGAAASSDKRSLSSAWWLWLMGSCRSEQQQRLNTRHCPQPGPGDGMKAVAVTGRDISIHWPVDMPWGNAVSSSTSLIGMQNHLNPY